MIPLAKILGMSINGTIAASSIYSIGHFTIKYCEELFTSEKSINVLKKATESYNNGVDEMKKLSETFK